MSWKVAEAKQHLSEMIRAAQKEPQIIKNRDTLVAGVLGAVDLEAYLELRDKHQPTLKDAIDALVAVAAEEEYTLHPPSRADRSNPLVAPTKQKRKRKRRAPR